MNGPSSPGEAFEAMLSAPTSSTVPFAWSRLESPEEWLPRRRWVVLFRAVGFTVDGEPAEPPTRPLTLYRGAPDRRRYGLSWTASRATVARWLEPDPTSGEIPRLWTARVEPSRLLARIGAMPFGRGEDEYVVDTHGLDVEPCGPEDRP